MLVCGRDKAGGYGIQALGGMLVEYVHGDFLNVVGFPLNHFCKQLDLIYNTSAVSSDQDILSVSKTKDSSHTSSIPTQVAPKPPVQSWTTLPSLTSTGKKTEVTVIEREDSEPTKEDLHRIIKLMDGFKASKVEIHCASL